MLNELSNLAPPLTIGLNVTFRLFVFASALGLAVSIVAALTQVSKFGLIQSVGRIYIELFRGTSVLVQLFWLYFVLPLLGVDLSSITVGVLGLGLNFGAYGAEIIRGTIQSIPRGQFEASIALNMNTFVMYRRIILPQALVRAIPGIGNLLIELLKGTSLVSLITINDLTFQAQMLRSATLETTKIFVLVLLIYFVLAQVVTYAVRRVERSLSRGMVSGGFS